MGMLVAAGIGLVIGFMLDQYAGAVTLAVLAGFLYKYRELSRLVGFQHEQLLYLTQSFEGAYRRGTEAIGARFREADGNTCRSPCQPRSCAPSEPDSPAPVVPAWSAPQEQASIRAAQVARPGVAAPRVQQAGDTLASLWSSSALGKLLARTNMITRVGIVILFLGVSFLIKYAAESITVPIEMRLAGIAAAALVVFAIGWRLRHTRRDYALLLQGAAVGSWYLVTYAGMKMYPVMPASAGFLILLGLSVFAALMSITQDAKSLAVFGILGGFLAPVLASTGAAATSCCSATTPFSMPALSPLSGSRPGAP